MIAKDPAGRREPIDLEWIQSLPERYGWPTQNERGYKIDEVPSGLSRPLRVVVLGGGASGINFAKFAQDELENVEFVLYEKNNDIGGTWLENRYPGCACDVPSVTYQYTWEPHIWSRFYASSPEINEYLKGVAKKYDVEKYIRLNHKIEKAEWDETIGRWNIEVQPNGGEKFIDQCDIFINAGGPLNYWEWPKIEGLETFKGIKAHSAAYPEGLDLKGKRVAVAGIGSSGIQIIASIQKEVSHLYTWIRSPTYVVGNFGTKYAMGTDPNPEYTEEQKEMLRTNPELYLKYRKNLEATSTVRFGVFYKGTPESIAAKEYCQNQMKQELEGHDDIIEALVPKTFPVGCKRPTPGSGFLKALISENTTTYTNFGLNRITEKGFIDPDGNEQEVDVIILATGFNTTWVPRFPILGRNGVNLQDLYTKNPLSYLGVSAPYMPNYFTYYGPYGPLGQASAVVMMDFFTRYMLKMIRKIQTRRIHSLAPKWDVCEKFQEHANLYLERTVWADNCKSWWKGGREDGPIMLYPGTRTQYMELLDDPAYEDYDIKYQTDNQWSFLGNGYSVRDYDKRDLTWYMGLVEGKDEQKDFDVSELFQSTS